MGLGGQGGVRILRDLDDRFDAAFGASGAFVPDLEHSATYLPTGPGNLYGSRSGGSSYISSDLNFQILDAELGHTQHSQTGSEVRFFGGLRALHFGASSEATLNDGGTGAATPPSVPTTTTIVVDSDFFGIGPRLGIEGSHGLFGSAIGLTGSFSAALLLGVTNTDTGVSSVVTAGGAPNPDLPTGFNPGTDDRSFEAAVVVEGDIGLEFDISNTNSLTLGYQAQYFHNVGSDNPVFDSDAEHHISHGLFFRWRREL